MLEENKKFGGFGNWFENPNIKIKIGKLPEIEKETDDTIRATDKEMERGE